MDEIIKLFKKIEFKINCIEQDLYFVKDELIKENMLFRLETYQYFYNQLKKEFNL